MRVLITGATGFVGQHLIEHLQAVGGYELFGLARRPAPGASAIRSFAVDLNRDYDKFVAILRDIRPEAIFHLAGFASAAASFDDPRSAWEGNLSASLALFRAVAESGVTPRILFVSTGAVYGNALATANPCTEETLLKPDHPYAASKAAADLAAYQAYCFPGLQIIRVRPFNQIGPGQSNGYALSGFAERITRIEADQLPAVLETANLDMERDLTDVRDMVRAYRLLIECGQPGEVYNAAAGNPTPMRHAAKSLLARAKCTIELDEHKERRRPADVQVMRISTAKILSATGWRPTIPLEQSLDDMLADWRRRVGSV